MENRAALWWYRMDIHVEVADESDQDIRCEGKSNKLFVQLSQYSSVPARQVYDR